MIEKIKTDYTISSLKANLFALPVVFLTIIFLYIPYIMIWDLSLLLSAAYSPFMELRFFLPAFVILAFLHEVIHWLAFRFIGKIDPSHLKIGFQWKTITPYAHCDIAMKTSAYRVSLILPALLLGIIPSVVALVFGIPWLMIYGMIFTVVSGGDFIILWLIRKVKKDQLLQDHPSRCGCKISST